MVYASEAGKFNIALAGDCMLTRRLRVFDEPEFLNLVKIFRDCDVGTGNLESVVRHWDERLVKLQVAFQRRVLQEVERFEPDARQWIGSITWLYPDDSDCPHLAMPDPSIWATVEHVDIEIDDVQEDLARLFAVRDADRAVPSADPTTH